jgi:pullulanase
MPEKSLKSEFEAPAVAPSYPWVTPGEVPLGALWGPLSTTFRVFAHADTLRLRLVHPQSLEVIEREMVKLGLGTDVWECTAPGNLRHWSYSYTLTRGGETLGDIVDPWARLIRGGRGIVHHDETQVTARPKLDPRDAIIYEMHVRDFTRDHTSGVRHDWRGRYPGVTQRGTRYNGTEISTGFDHLLELGVNVLQLMPVHSFSLPYHAEYEWGYMPMDFNAPHEGYAAGIDADAPAREFKRLVSDVHAAGLRVTVDVVYNHTFERWPFTPGADTDGKPAPARLRSFMALAPTEYFRFGKDGKPSNGSACGNEFRSDSPMGRRFIIESVKYWVYEYGIDGYRFDLMGLIDAETMGMLTKELHAIEPSLLVYGEPWAGGETPIEVNNKGKQRGKGWGVFNDDFRDGLRGEVFKPEESGFLARAEGVEAKQIARVKAGMLGGVTTFADAPLETINYIECHDNHTLRDRLAFSTKNRARVTASERERMNRLGALMLLTSPGIPFIHSGQELGRSKGGHDNTYNLGDEINNIPWALKDANHRLFRFYQEAVALRAAHPMFKPMTREAVVSGVKFLDDDLGLKLPLGVIGCVVTDASGADEWSKAVLLFNGSEARVSVPIPAGKWKSAVDDGSFSTLAPEKRGVTTGKVEIGPHSGSVLYQERR